MSNLSTLFDRYKALVVFDTETSGLDFDNKAENHSIDIESGAPFW